MDSEPKTVRAVVDRVEEGFAVLELPVDYFVDFPLSALPDGIEGGEVVEIQIKVSAARHPEPPGG